LSFGKEEYHKGQMWGNTTFMLFCTYKAEWKKEESQWRN